MNTANNKSNAAMCGLMIVLMLAVSAWAWTQLPADARLPIHWNASGQVDGYGGRFAALFIMPIMAAVVAATLLILPLFDPRKPNLARSSKAYAAACIAIMGFLLCLHLAVVAAAFGKPVRVPMVANFVSGVMFIVLGNYMAKVRSNFIFGIRTPWTLSSELSWHRTHRLGARLFILLGLGVIVSAVTMSDAVTIGILVGGLLLATLVVSVYSYVVWKNDPQKTPAGMSPVHSGPPARSEESD